MERFNVSESVEITQFKSLGLDENNFKEIIELMTNVFNKIGIDLECKSIFYQRFHDGKSMLVIKVLDGEDEDKNNYMFVGCDTKYYGNDISCNVYMRAEAKASQVSINISNLIASKIVSFFEGIEQELLDKKSIKLEVFLKLPLVIDNERELLNNDKPKTKGSLKRIIGNIFGVKNEN